MTSSHSDPNEQVSVRVRVRHQPSKTVRRFMSSHKTPIQVLLLSALVGVGAGLLGTLFEMGVSWISSHRTDWLKTSILSDFAPLMWIAAVALSAIFAMFGYYLVHRFAPEAGGSGIPEIEGAMDGVRPVRWWRVLPVKFFGGLGALGSGMVLGREGPTVQMGGNVGQMMADIFRLKDKEGVHTLLASGAAGGLAAAFNAPLAGVMFVVEEMRPQFRYNLISIKAVMISAIVSNIVFRMLRGQDAVITMPQFDAAPLGSLWLFLLLGLLFGLFGVCFNKLVIQTIEMFQRIHRNERKRFVLTGAAIGAVFGLLLLYVPEITSGGIIFIPEFSAGHYGLVALLAIFAFRLLTTLICFGSGAPGGIFAPMLALGTLFGTFFGTAACQLLPDLGISPGMFAIAGMGALFAATVRAPITGILLVIEMTHNYDLMLPLLITTLGAVMVAQMAGGKPIYSQLLQRTLDKQRAQQKSAEAEEEAQQPA
ncbi:H(+)/Cl(-) exchange transporter ClcA [Vibrio stylophorae]|uniref:H(+)/Cl(-) exchange transporter ClcA n=1 Tax=Vibrio stylophorae TaxID=659351 RepID=A0ABN8DR89_9VIBR|nr:H(+)/Cl(-) exchange transporter ClcA [Vibrio stylophorae]CAH0533676.1 H(+)/Cl(-) exchange transporter ClcA [Vibrio stylophorae]